MTGLDVVADALIEVAALVTDFELNVLGDGVNVVVKPPPESLAQMNEVVTQMHTASACWPSSTRAARCRRLRPRCSSTYAPTYRRSGRHRWPATPSARTGCSLHATCRSSRTTCTTASSMSRRSRSSRAVGSRGPTSALREGGNHRALADIRESIEELRYYRAAVFVPSPGPDSTAAKALAAEHRGSLTD
jgi:oligoribonuclease